MGASRTLKETVKDKPRGASEDAAHKEPVPGIVLVFSGDRPAFQVIALENGAIEIGREIAGVPVDDPRMSRVHASVSFDGRRWVVRDLESSNGTAADGEMVARGRTAEARRVVRAGASLFLLAADTRPFHGGIARVDGAVQGPSLQRAFRAIARAARFGSVLHITGESGSGKELSARAFHQRGPASGGPFVAVNAAALPASLAEALLFGVRKGVHSAAGADRVGFVQAAHGGTLFLDEVAELDLEVQAALLRALDTREIMPLGAVRPERVDIRLCSATNANLRSLVAEGKMREDLYFRISTPTVVLPPLRERLEEIPWLVEQAVKGVAVAGPALDVSFVEACLLRRWPGNVRELMAEAHAAAQWAADEGSTLLAEHLAPHAGMEMKSEPHLAPHAGTETKSEPPAARATPSDEAIEEALSAAGNKVARAAKALGMHRTQLVRWTQRRERKAKGGEGEG